MPAALHIAPIKGATTFFHTFSLLTGHFRSARGLRACDDGDNDEIGSKAMDGDGLVRLKELKFDPKRRVARRATPPVLLLRVRRL